MMSRACITRVHIFHYVRGSLFQETTKRYAPAQTQKSKQMYRPLEPTGLLPQSGSLSKINKSVETCQKHWRRSPRSRPFTIVNAEPTRAAAPHLYVSWVDISQLSISSSPTFLLIFFPMFIQTRYVGQQHIPCIIN